MTCRSSQWAPDWQRRGIGVTLNAAMVVGGAKMGCRSESFTNRCWSTYIFTTSQPPLGFTENESIQRKHPVSGSCEEEKSLVDGSGSGLRWSCTADAHCCAGKDGWDSETSFTGLHAHTNKHKKNMKITSFFSMLQINVVTDLILPESWFKSKFQSPADTLKASMKVLLLQIPQSSIPHHWLWLLSASVGALRMHWMISYYHPEHRPLHAHIKANGN